MPILLFAQDGYSRGNSLLGVFTLFLIGLAIALGVFLLIRSLMLWYWKVYELLQNQKNQIYEQQQTNYLLTVQNELLMKHLKIEKENTAPQS